MRFEALWLLYWFGIVPDGFEATSSEERWTAHPATPRLAADMAQIIAGARHCGQGCNTLLHLCSGVYVAWPPVVGHQKEISSEGETWTAGANTNLDHLEHLPKSLVSAT